MMSMGVRIGIVLTVALVLIILIKIIQRNIENLDLSKK